MTEGELSALLHLIRSPDVRCLGWNWGHHADDWIVSFLEGSLPPLLLFDQRPLQVSL